MAQKKPSITIITATKLSSSQQKEVESVVKKKVGPAVYEYITDPSVIGGLKIEVGDQSLDATIASELGQLTSQLPKVVVTTAVPLSASQKKKIASAIENKIGASEFEEKIDPSIIGGLLILIDDEEYDGTIRGKLQKLRSTMLQNI